MRCARIAGAGRAIIRTAMRNNGMRRFISLLFTCVVICLLCACGESVSDSTTQHKTDATTTTTQRVSGTTTTTTATTVPYTIISDEGFTYAVEGNGLIVTEYYGSAEHIEIPQMVDGKPVVEIGFGVFKDSKIKSVTIPFGVKTIGAYAFYNTPLESVDIPETVTFIGNNAFSYTSLTEFESPLGVSVIGFEVFSFCDSLQSVILGNNIEEVHQGAFAFCQSLEAVYIPDSVDYISDSAFEGWFDGLVLYGKENSYGQQYAEDNGMEFEIV